MDRLRLARHLIALGGSSNEHEAASASLKACAVLRELMADGIDPVEAIAALPAHDGPVQSYSPPQQEMLYLPPDEDWLDENRRLQELAAMREAQAIAARIKQRRAEMERDEAVAAAEHYHRLANVRNTREIVVRGYVPMGAGRRPMPL